MRIRKKQDTTTRKKPDHNQPKNHECNFPECGKAYQSEKALKVHQKTHAEAASSSSSSSTKTKVAGKRPRSTLDDNQGGKVQRNSLKVKKVKKSTGKGGKGKGGGGTTHHIMSFFGHSAATPTSS